MSTSTPPKRTYGRQPAVGDTEARIHRENAAYRAGYNAGHSAAWLALIQSLVEVANGKEKQWIEVKTVDNATYIVHVKATPDLRDSPWHREPPAVGEGQRPADE